MSVTWGRRSSRCTWRQSGTGRGSVDGAFEANRRASRASSSRSSGSGQVSPAALARLTWSATVVNGICSEAATSRRLRLSWRLSRRTSRTLRMLIWGRGTGASSNGLGRQFESRCPAPSHHASATNLLLPRCTKTPESVYGFVRNGCTKTSGAHNVNMALALFGSVRGRLPSGHARHPEAMQSGSD